MKLENMVGQKASNHPPEISHLSNEDMIKAYHNASSHSERLYIKKGTKYLAIDDLNSYQLQQIYRELINDRTKLFSESELKQMGIGR
jgi:hypothetical protein